jgi:NADH-quinone oxidoreductase subunit A
MTSPLVGYALVFVAVGAAFILVHLLIGKMIRPNKPDPEKKTIYECGEPTIGSAWIQFDLRFYVVALLFVIFDVEVAFFFPWAEVFGKSNALAVAPDPQTDAEKAAFADQVRQLIPDYRENAKARETAGANPAAVRRDAFALSWLALIEIAVFFGILLVGFAYLWRRGDLEWVRSTLAESPASPVEEPAPTPAAPQELVGAGGGH